MAATGDERHESQGKGKADSAGKSPVKKKARTAATIY